MTDTAYADQLAAKVERLNGLLAPYAPPVLSVYPSPPSHYRMRAEFRIWHTGDDLFHAMFDPETRKPVRVEQFETANPLINALMAAIIPLLRAEPLLKRKLFEVDYLTTTSGEALISLLYHRQLDDDWRVAAEALRAALQSIARVDIVGRARKQQVLLHRDHVEERFVVGGHTYHYRHVENAFSQPNAAICQSMLDWATDVTRSANGDLLELYCGNGNFSLPMSANFRRVLATELARSAVFSAEWAIAKSGVTNVTVVRAPAEEVSQALTAGTVVAKKVDLSDWDCRTLLVDPPRAGLDDDTRRLAQRFEWILYISCNPETLSRDLAAWHETHEIAAAALFDQFPFTDHIESGVWLRRRDT